MLKNNRFARLLFVVLMLSFSLMLMGSTMLDEDLHHHELRAKLSGAAEVPGPGDPDGKGQARITLMMVGMDQHQLCWEIKVKDITLPATAAHIHSGVAGVAGPVVVPLSPPDANGYSSGCTFITHELAMDLHMHPEKYYVNDHTIDYPAGALRGQLFLGE